MAKKGLGYNTPKLQLPDQASTSVGRKYARYSLPTKGSNGFKRMTWLNSGVAPANQTEKKVRFENFPGRSLEFVPEPPFFGGFCVVFTSKRGRSPEPVPDSFPGSSQTSLSSVWFAGATSPDELARNYSGNFWPIWMPGQIDASRLTLRHQLQLIT